MTGAPADRPPGRPSPGGAVTSRRLGAPLVTAGVVLAATATVALRDPHAPGSYGLCPSLALLGVACPLCGGLRATHDLAHLDLAGAWAANPLWVALVPLVVLAWAGWTARAARGRAAPRVPAAAGWALAAVVLLFGVLRNVPALAGPLGPGA